MTALSGYMGFYRADMLEYVPDDIKEGIYHRVNFPDGRFIAIRPMYFNAWILIGTDKEGACEIIREYAVGTNDALIFLYYNMCLLLLCHKVILQYMPLPRTKIAIQDQNWVQLFREYFIQHSEHGTLMKQGAQMIPNPLTPFIKMHMQTLRPLINNAKRSLHESRKK